MKATCPICEAEIGLNDVMRGEIVTCPKCDSYLIVTSFSPLMLELDVDPIGEDDSGG